MTDKYDKLREAVTAFPKGWGKVTHTKQNDDEGTATVGALIDDQFYELFTVDCGLYFRPERSLPVAQYYAAANQPVIAALLAERDAKTEALTVAIQRIEDMLQGDDGQAFKEAQKELPRLKAALGDNNA